MIDPQIHDYIRSEIEAMGIDVEHLMKTEPETYEMLLKLYCCKQEVADNEEDQSNVRE
jgi:hypothetical protein